MIQFFAPDILENSELPEGESMHCCRVLRMKEGDEIVVTDGKGSRYTCEILKAHPSHTKIKIKCRENFVKTRNYNLVLAVAPTKNSDRVEWMIEKAVEVGVDKIVLLRCDRSERKNLRSDRLVKVMISAMKQSLSVILPELSEVTDFKEFVSGCNKTGQKFFGYCSDRFPRRSFVKELRPGGDVIVLIGPEGDFTPEEVELAVNQGFMPVTFGEKRLRTETAGVFAVCAVDIVNQLL